MHLCTKTYLLDLYLHWCLCLHWHLHFAKLHMYMYMVIWWPTPSGRFKHQMHPGPHQRAFLFTGTCFVMRCFFFWKRFHEPTTGWPGCTWCSSERTSTPKPRSHLSKGWWKYLGLCICLALHAQFCFNVSKFYNDGRNTKIKNRFLPSWWWLSGMATRTWKPKTV